MQKIFPKYLNCENISKKCIRVPGLPKLLYGYLQDPFWIDSINLFALDEQGQ